MVLLNARSLRNKMLEFRAWIAASDYQVVAVTETWLDTGSRDFLGEYHLPGYAMFQKDRVGRRGGGVMLYVRDHLAAIGLRTNSPHEFVGAELRGCDPALRVVVAYRPPHRQRAADESLYSDLAATVQGYATTILVGDFNCPIDWRQLVNVGAEGMRLVDFAHDTFMTQLVTVPTRGRNTLDLVFASDEEMVRRVEVVPGLEGSDHGMVTFEVMVRSESERIRSSGRLNLRRANYPRFVSELQEVTLQPQATVEEMWLDLKRVYLEIQARCIPLKSVGGTTKRNPSWVSREILAEIGVRKRMYRESLSDPTPAARRRLVMQRRLVKKSVRQAKATEERRVALACRDNPKEFYSYVNSFKVRKPLGPLQSATGGLVTGNAEMAREFNEYFANVFTVETADVPPPVLQYEGADQLDDVNLAEEEVKEHLARLDPNKAPGPDGFLPKVMKAVAVGLAPHLVRVFRLSMETGEVPQDWRSADVCPIHKKGPDDLACNFRPVSLTCVPGKVLESLLKKRIVDHLETNRLLVDSQHGFRDGRSCLTSLLEFYHKMFEAYDRSGRVDVIYLDFQKAFDKVPHRRLMAKVRALGIGGRVSRWVEAWLSERKQRVVVNGASSDWCPVTSGVPQGSVLGPLLFLVYINDIDSGLTTRICKFADDTKLGVDASKAEDVEALRSDLARLGEWSERWQMPFNTAKCHVLHVGSGNERAQYELCGTRVSPTVREVDLGVLVTSDFKVGEQCVAAERKAQKILGYVKRVFVHRNRETVMALYKTLVRPHLEYAVQFWSPTYRCDVDRLERIQMRATKLVPEIRNMGYERRLLELDLLTLEQRRLRGQLIETFKIVRGHSTLDPSTVFSFSLNPTRNHGFKLVVPRFRTNKFRDFMTVKVCHLWNSLPSELVNAPSVESFKLHLDRLVRELEF